MENKVQYETKKITPKKKENYILIGINLNQVNLWQKKKSTETLYGVMIWYRDSLNH